MAERTRAQPDLALVLKPVYTPSTDPESPRTQALIATLGLEEHIEGGYFLQTDAAEATMPSPYPPEPLSDHTVGLVAARPGFDAAVRRLSTNIFYLLTPRRSQASFHRNRSRIIHTLHRGRGRYVLIHPGGRVETFVVGQAIERGERLQWIVEGGVWKASFLLDDGAGAGAGAEGLLITETVVPGFEYVDHEFLSPETFRSLLPEENQPHLEWLVRKRH